MPPLDSVKRHSVATVDGIFRYNQLYPLRRSVDGADTKRPEASYGSGPFAQDLLD